MNDSKEDEEAIALGTTPEQSFAIAPEAGVFGERGGHVRVDTITITTNLCICLSAFLHKRAQPIYAFGYAPFLL